MFRYVTISGPDFNEQLRIQVSRDRTDPSNNESRPKSRTGLKSPFPSEKQLQMTFSKYIYITFKAFNDPDDIMCTRKKGRTRFQDVKSSFIDGIPTTLIPFNLTLWLEEMMPSSSGGYRFNVANERQFRPWKRSELLASTSRAHN